jgi:MoaA/NifB/PqqE/SkfB family radical SAM enzyme
VDHAWGQSTGYAKLRLDCWPGHREHDAVETQLAQLAQLKGYQAQRSLEDRKSFCHAPSVNLNFEQSGKVTACCYNRSFVLGSYPEDSISDIWSGPRADELRKALQAGDLSKGCSICREQLVAGNYAGMRARHFDGFARGASGLPFPRIMEFELSNTCNLECIMCDGYFSSAIRKNREKLPPYPRRFDREFVRQLRPFLPNLEWARFLGGEPFLNGLYFDIWDELIRIGSKAKVVITSNGSILNDRVKRVLETLQADVILSIDSLDEKNYETIRLGASFSQLMKNVDYLAPPSKKAKKAVSIAVCPMRMNWKDLPAIVDFCNERDLVVHFNTVYRPEELALRTMSAGELGEVGAFLSRAVCLKPDPRHFNGARNAATMRDLILQLDSWRSSR